MLFFIRTHYVSFIRLYNKASLLAQGTEGDEGGNMRTLASGVDAVYSGGQGDDLQKSKGAIDLYVGGQSAGAPAFTKAGSLKEHMFERN